MKRDMIVPFPTPLGPHTTSAAESRVFVGDNFARVSGDAAETQLFAWDSEREKLGVKGAIIHVQAEPEQGRPS